VAARGTRGTLGVLEGILWAFSAEYYAALTTLWKLSTRTRRLLMGVLLGTQAVVGRVMDYSGVHTRAHARTLAAGLRRTGAGARARARLRLRHRPVSRALAAGVTWTCRTSKAPWAARASHTSVIDAAGAIYVIGGYDTQLTCYRDVWASTDGGLDRTRAGGWSGATGWVPRGY
jgi:hypothetical protein